MDETRLRTIFQLQALLAGTLEARHCMPDSDDARHLGCVRPDRPDEGVVRHYLLAAWRPASTCHRAVASFNTRPR